jgi:lipid-A-disaccharide synthase
MKISRVAVLASGTATLECALAGTPMVVVYVMNDFSYWIARRAVSIKWASLVNLLMNDAVVPEHLQTIDPEVVATEVLELASESFARRRMLAKFDELTARLLPGAAYKAVQTIAEYISEIKVSPRVQKSRPNP